MRKGPAVQSKNKTPRGESKGNHTYMASEGSRFRPPACACCRDCEPPILSEPRRGCWMRPRAGSSKIPPTRSPGSSGCAEPAVLQCRWEQLLASVAAQAETLQQQLLFSELLPVIPFLFFFFGPDEQYS